MREDKTGFPGGEFEGKKAIQERVRLREGIKNIQGQTVDIAKGNEDLESVREQMDEDEDTIHWVDFIGGDLEILEQNGFKHDGVDSYLISPIDERDWFSDQYANCTAVVGIGRDAVTGKEISFLSHQDPNYFVDGGEEKAGKFAKDLAETIQELKTRSQEDTVEVSLSGGNFNPAARHIDYRHEQYGKSIVKLRQVIQESLGYDPKVLAGPNHGVGSETVVVVKTQQRKVWIERDKQPQAFDEPYQANELEKMEKKWQ